MHHEDLNSPGYWFTAPYKALDQDQSDRSWVGPCIYDGKNGELIWSGGLMFDRGNIEDFRISNVKGEYLMTMMAQGRAQGIVLDSDYTIRKAFKFSKHGGGLNTHEFNFIENGTRTIYLNGGQRKASRKESKKVGFNGECSANYDGFSVLDVTKDDWPHVFDWDSYGKIGLDESTLTAGSPAGRCTGGWDFM